MNSTYDTLKNYFSNFKEKTEELTFFFHPDDNLIIIEYNNENPDIQLQEVEELIKKNNVELEDKYQLFKNHMTSTLKKLQKENVFKQSPFYIYTQYVDGGKELVLKIEQKNSKSIFPEPQDFNFDLSMVNKGNGKTKWWKVITPTWQDDDLRPFQKLEIPKDAKELRELYSWRGISIKHKMPEGAELISYSKIKKLWDYENSDLYEVFSNRFCQMLTQIGVTNIEYYPIKSICKTTKQSSDTYYQLVNIIGLVDEITFFDKKIYRRQNIKVERKPNHRGVVRIHLEDPLGAKKNVLDKISEKIIRCKDKPQIFIVDNDIKAACEANNITGIEFQEVELI